jgi:hypothetical protein
MVDGFTRDVEQGDLATVVADHAAHVPGPRGGEPPSRCCPGS